MALSYPENTVWYIEARPWQGPDKDNPGFAPVEPTSRGSGVVITLTKELPNDERKTQTYLLTCAHVVRDRKDLLLEDIICYPPGLGFVGTGEKTRKSGEFEKSTVQTASVSKYSPCKGERGPRPDELSNDPASDWVLLEIDDATFRHQPSVKALLREDGLSADATLQVTGFPGGDITWTNGDMVSPATARGFRLRGYSTPGILDYEGSEETHAGMSGCGIFDEKGTLVGIHRSSTDAAMKREGVRAAAIARQLLENYQMEFSSGIRQASAPGNPIARAKKQLKSLLWDFELDDDLDALVRNEFKRLEREGMASSDEDLLEKIGNAYDDHGEWEALVNFLETLDKKIRNITAGPDYTKLAKQLERGEVILCLGQEISHLSGAFFVRRFWHSLFCVC
ncbi:MAG: trypsin-like peptidase domain-containing protein, partial [Gammaproteobacteria bacterium]|nr:trypsin-like peptidase domain-containing protein [Gammaproteobacteria bacterium]